MKTNRDLEVKENTLKTLNTIFVIFLFHILSGIKRNSPVCLQLQGHTAENERGDRRDIGIRIDSYIEGTQ